MFYAPECPYLFKDRQELSFQERFEVVVNNVNHSKVCTRHPLCVQEHGVFVIRRSAVKHRDDWLDTDLRSFANKRQSGRAFKVEGEEVISTRQWPRRVEERFQLEDDEYLVLSTYWRHAKYKDFSPITTVVSQKHNKELDLVLLQYYFQGDEHHISPKKHPSSKPPFIPTSSSTRNSIVEKVKKPMGPSTIYDQVFQELGGMMGAEAVVHTPRNISQIKNMRPKLPRKCNDDDEFSSLLTFTKEKGQSCLRGFQWTPATRIVYAEDWQMVKIMQNCCQVNSASVLSIDTTFNVGKFYVTSTTYQNRNFINQRTARCSNLPGPALFHVCQDESQFFYFSYTLLEVNYGFEKVRFIEGDRDKAQKGFLKPLKGVTYLPCKKHLQENMKAKMQSLQLSGTEKNNYVFGND